VVAQVAQGFGRNALDERAPFVAIEDRRVAGLHDVLRSAHRRGGIQWDDLAGDQPIEQHPTAARCCFTSGAECVRWRVSM
jgi:hypothetical protein